MVVFWPPYFVMNVILGYTIFFAKDWDEIGKPRRVGKTLMSDTSELSASDQETLDAFLDLSESLLDEDGDDEEEMLLPASIA